MRRYTSFLPQDIFEKNKVCLGVDETWAQDMDLMFASEGVVTLTGIPKETLISGNIIEMFQTMCVPTALATCPVSSRTLPH